MDVQTAIDEFLLSIRAEGVSLNTVKWYTSILRTFAREYGQHPIASIKPNDLRLYLAETRERSPNNGTKPRKISLETLYAYHRVLNTLFAWINREYGLSNPMLGIKKPRKPRHNPKGVERGNIVKMFNVADARDKLIVAFLTDTGCRVSELCNILIKDIDFERLQVVVIGKGAKPRTLLFSPFTRELMRKYLVSRGVESEALLVGRFGQLSRWGVHRVLKTLAQRAGIQGRFNPHSFRHGFAREYLMNGGDLATLSQLLGHSDPSFTAEVYAVFDMENLRKLHMKNSPIHMLE